jgi:broad specificity phosphatase PhoE
VKLEAVRLILIRHGEVEANRSYQYLGRRDDPLNDTGVGQAQAIARTLRALPLSLVLTSPLDRTRSTARGLRRSGAPVRDEPRLLELDFGDWEGLSRSELTARSASDQERVLAWEADPNLSPPRGESLVELRERVVALADELARDAAGDTVALVSHMGPIKMLLCTALDLPLTRASRIFLDPATISVVDWGPRPVVRLVNSHSHLGFDHARWLHDS